MSQYKKRTGTKCFRPDRHIVTNRWLALPIFAAVMWLVYYVSVTTVGTWATDWANDGVFGDGWSLFGLEVPGIPVLVESLLNAAGCADWLQGLILDGIVAGVGAVLGFVPQMLVLFIFWPSWKAAVIWQGLPSSWTEFSANSAFPENLLSRCSLEAAAACPASWLPVPLKTTVTVK